MTFDLGFLFAIFMASIGAWAFLKAMFKIFRFVYIEHKQQKVMKRMVTLYKVGLRETMLIRSAKYEGLKVRHKS